MRQLILIGYVLLALIVYPQDNNKVMTMCQKAYNVAPNPNDGCLSGFKYALVFEDNFDGNALNLSTWGVPYQGVTRDFNHNLEKQYYINDSRDPLVNVLPMSNNIEVSNGTLKIHAQKHVPAITAKYTDYSTNPWTDIYENFDYSSANISTSETFHYGKYEIRCKIPKGKGFWPAFWLFSQNPYYNELDFFEFWNENNNWNNYDASKLAKYPHLSIHYDYNQLANGTYNSCGNDLPSTADYSQAFHIFTIYWFPLYIEYFIDGAKVFEISKYKEPSGGNNINNCNSLNYNSSTYERHKSYPSDPMHIILNLAIQSGSNQPDANTPFPSAFEIDYVRYYKPSDCYNSFENFTNISQVQTQFVQNNVKGSKLNFSSGFTIPAVNSSPYLFTGRDEVVFKDGFTATAGCDLKAQVDPNICIGILKPNNSLSNALFNLSNQSDSSSATITSYFDQQNLHINSNHTQLNIFSAKLLDMTGKTIFYKEGINNGTAVKYNMSHLAKGIYMIKLQDQNSGFVLTKKLMYE